MTKKPFHLQPMKPRESCPEPSVRVTAVLTGDAARFLRTKANMAEFVRWLVEEHVKSLDAGEPTCKSSAHGSTAST